MNAKKTTEQPNFRDRAGDAFDSARERAIEAYDSARDRAVSARTSASDTIGSAPLIALAGGLATGALLAALLPATRREKELLGPVAGRIREKAGEAATAAKEAGQARLDELGLTREAGTDTLKSIFEGASDAAKASAQAAASTLRGEEQPR